MLGLDLDAALLAEGGHGAPGEISPVVAERRRPVPLPVLPVYVSIHSAAEAAK